MFNHKIYNLLQTFSSDEIRRLGRFIKSPYFTGRSKIPMLYEEIIKYYPSFTHKNLIKKNLYKTIFQSNNYKDSSIRNLLIDLLNLTERFLSIENFERDKYDFDNHLLEELFDRKQNELFLRSLKKVSKERKNFQKMDFRYLFNSYKLERNEFNFFMVNDKIIKKGKVFTHIEKLNDSAIYLSTYCITELISEHINMIIYSEKFNISNITNFVSEMLEVLDIKRISKCIGKDNECSFVLKLYMALFSAFSNFNRTKYYHYYKKLLNEYLNKLSRDEISFHYSILISYCILKERSEKHRNVFGEELLNLYSIVLEHEYYKNKKVNYLPAELFRDILFLGIRLKKLEFMEKLINVYNDRVDPKRRHNMYYFGCAFYNYEIGCYEKSLNCLNKIKIDYFIYKYDVKNLMLRLYYELNYFEEGLCLIQSYRELLRNDKFLSNTRKLPHKNFIMYLKKLILYRTGALKENIGYIKKELIGMKEVSYKKWLLEKINKRDA